MHEQSCVSSIVIERRVRHRIVDKTKHILFDRMVFHVPFDVIRSSYNFPQIRHLQILILLYGMNLSPAFGWYSSFTSCTFFTCSFSKCTVSKLLNVWHYLKFCLDTMDKRNKWLAYGQQCVCVNCICFFLSIYRIEYVCIVAHKIIDAFEHVTIFIGIHEPFHVPFHRLTDSVIPYNWFSDYSQMRHYFGDFHLCFWTNRKTKSSSSSS